jgi:hypothetical protein
MTPRICAWQPSSRRRLATFDKKLAAAAQAHLSGLD